MSVDSRGACEVIWIRGTVLVRDPQYRASLYFCIRQRKLPGNLLAPFTKGGQNLGRRRNRGPDRGSAGDIDEVNAGGHSLGQPDIQCADLRVDVDEEGEAGPPSDFHY
jgi:hypothetical protein